MDFESWIEGQPEWTRRCLTKLRGLLAAMLPEARESVKWQAWTFSGRRLICGISGHRAHMSLVLHQGSGFADFDDWLEVPGGSGALRMKRFRSFAELSGERLQAVLRRAAALDETPVARSRQPVLEAAPPDELAAALRDRQDLAGRFAALAPSCRREFVRWVGEAKRPETRARRAGVVMARLESGKPGGKA